MNTGPPLPRYDGQPQDTGPIGHYTNAFLAGGNVVATWSAGCEVPLAIVVRPNGQPRPLLGSDLATAPAAHVLGTTQDGQAVVHVLDSPQCGRAGQPGIHLIDPDTGNTTRVLTASGIQAAEMWTPRPSLSD